MELIELSINKDPVEIYSHLRNEFDHTFLLESMTGPSEYTTQSLIGFDPISIFKIKEDTLYVDEESVANGIDNIIDYMEERLEQYSHTTHPNQYIGGLVGFTSYDIIRSIEDIPDNSSTSAYPDAIYGLYLDGIRIDHKNQTIQYFYHDHVPNRFEQIIDILSEYLPKSDPIRISQPTYLFSKEDFEKAVKQIKDGIIRGETFQTVLSQRINFEISGDHLAIYSKLRKINPSPHMYFLEFENYSIIGSSPELLVSSEDNIITTYPIAGTRRLSKDTTENQQLEKDLLADEKERAEHNMLVDLARNDIGKIAKNGTVKVTEYMSVEYFSHVMHIVSKVQGDLRSDLSLFDAFYAVFPAGTVSGAPKIRSMQIIEQLEPIRRGPYAGSVGYFGINKEMIQAITIRTAFGIGNQFSIQAGAGIVLDSDPTREYEETLHKLAALFEALQT